MPAFVPLEYSIARELQRKRDQDSQWQNATYMRDNSPTLTFANAFKNISDARVAAPKAKPKADPEMEKLRKDYDALKAEMDALKNPAKTEPAYGYNLEDQSIPYQPPPSKPDVPPESSPDMTVYDENGRSVYWDDERPRDESPSGTPPGTPPTEPDEPPFTHFRDPSLVAMDEIRKRNDRIYGRGKPLSAVEMIQELMNGMNRQGRMPSERDMRDTTWPPPERPWPLPNLHRQGQSPDDVRDNRRRTLDERDMDDVRDVGAAPSWQASILPIIQSIPNANVDELMAFAEELMSSG